MAHAINACATYLKPTFRDALPRRDPVLKTKRNDALATHPRPPTFLPDAHLTSTRARSCGGRACAPGSRRTRWRQGVGEVLEERSSDADLPLGSSERRLRVDRRLGGARVAGGIAAPEAHGAHFTFETRATRPARPGVCAAASSPQCSRGGARARRDELEPPARLGRVAGAVRRRRRQGFQGPRSQGTIRSPRRTSR